MPAAAPPEGAKTVRVALIARGGPRTDDADLVAKPPQTPTVRVLTNQADTAKET